MRDNGIRDTITTLIESDPACLDAADLRDGLGLLRHVQGWASAGIIEYTRHLERVAANANSSCPGGDAASALTTEMGHTPGEAQSTIEQADLCDKNRGIETSLAAGEITDRHVKLIAKYRKALSAAERSDFDLQLETIHHWAKNNHLRYFERQLKDLVARIRRDHTPDDDDGETELRRQRQHSGVKNWVEPDTGLHKFMLTMDPVRAESFESAYRAELAALRNDDRSAGESFGSLQIQAIINAMSGGEAAKRSTELIVVVDHKTLTGGRHEHSVCETLGGSALPVPTVQRLCDEAIINLFAADDSNKITKAVEQRTATRAQRRALAAMYRTCAFPDCGVTIGNCRMHHIQQYSRGGPTQLSNLLPLCETHHHFIHDRGWTIALDPDDRCATFTDPAGDTSIDTHPDRLQTPDQAGSGGGEQPSLESARRRAPRRDGPAPPKPETLMPQGAGGSSRPITLF